MTKIQKLILPILIILVVAVVYFSYFKPKDDLGLFSSFDKDSHIHRDIIVKFVSEKGVKMDQTSGKAIFYVKDKAGVEMMVAAPLQLPPGMDMAIRLTIKGHIHGNTFDAVEVRLRN